MIRWPSLSEIEKPLVQLHDISEDQLGLIVLWRSGVIYTNQTGGHYCTHPTAEGIFFPLGTEEQQDALTTLFTGPRFGGASAAIDDEDATVIDEVLWAVPSTRFLTVDRGRLATSHEAWVYVTIGPHPDRHPPLPILGNTEAYADPDSALCRSFSTIFGFGEAKGVLTWVNSD